MKKRTKKRTTKRKVANSRTLIKRLANGVKCKSVRIKRVNGALRVEIKK